MARAWTDALSFRGIALKAIAPEGGEIYVYNASTNLWEAWTPSDVTYTVWTLDDWTPSADGVQLSWWSIIMQSASATVPWLVNTTTQAFSGQKTFEAILHQLVVSPNTETPVELTTADSATIYTNEWTEETISFALPTAAAWLTYTFIVQNEDWVTIVANTWDTIQFNEDITATGWEITSVDVWSTITLVAINDTERVATSIVWTWVIPE